MRREISLCPDAHSLLEVLLATVDDLDRGILDVGELHEIAARVRSQLSRIDGTRRWEP